MLTHLKTHLKRDDGKALCGITRGDIVEPRLIVAIARAARQPRTQSQYSQRKGRVGGHCQRCVDAANANGFDGLVAMSLGITGETL